MIGGDAMVLRDCTGVAAECEPTAECFILGPGNHLCEVVGGPEIEREERPPGNLPGAFDLADLATSWT